MSVTRKHSLYHIVGDTTALAGINRQMLNTGTEVYGEPVDGGVYRRFQSVIAQRPTGEFTSLCVAQAIDLIALTGQSIASWTAKMAWWFQKHAHGGTRAGATSHRKIVVNDGLVFPRRLSCSHQGNAAISYDMIASYDGTNDPFVITDAQSLPTAVADDERFTIGPVTIGGVSLPEIKELEIDFGLQAVSEGSDSEIWDRFISFETIQPMIRLRGIDIEWLKSSNIPLAGKAATHANTTVTLRKRADGGTFVADATAEHIGFTACGLAFVSTPFDGSGSGAGMVSLEAPLQFDGTNAPLVVDTTYALA